MDYLDQLIPMQQKTLKKVVDGGITDVARQVKTIELVLELMGGAEEAYDYDSILKVLYTWINSGKGHIKLDVLRRELRESFTV